MCQCRMLKMAASIEARFDVDPKSLCNKRRVMAVLSGCGLTPSAIPMLEAVWV